MISIKKRLIYSRNNDLKPFAQKSNNFLGKILLLIILFLFFSSEISSCNYIKKNPIINLPNKYHELLSKFDSNFPGRGAIDYSDNPIGDIPKSYAMFLSAELFQASSLNPNANFVQARKAGYWLLDNMVTDNWGNRGWGLPVEWDAYGDNTINPSNTIYTISDAIVINSLLDWLDKDPHAPKIKILQSVDAALAPFLSPNYRTNNHLFAYSLDPNDLKYETYNPSAYLAGQMQRYSQLVEDESYKEALQDNSDQIFDYLINTRKIDKNGGWYWNYSTPPDLNSLAHAGYIIDGFRNYIKYKGRLNNRIDWLSIYKHLDSFYDSQTGTFLFLPNSVGVSSVQPTRLYGLGFYLYLEGLCSTDNARINRMLKFTKNYEKNNGTYAIYPNSNLVINEYQSYLLYGYSSVISNFGKTDCVAQKKKNSELIDTNSPYLPIPVPFTNFNTPNHKVTLYFDSKNLQGELHIDTENPVLLPEKEIPLKIIEGRDKSFLIFCRSLFDSKILIHELLLERNWIDITIPDNIENYLFRQAIKFDDSILFILFDMEKQQNIVFKLNETNGNYIYDSSFLKELQINSLYKQQPHILTTNFNKSVFLFSGPSIFKITKEFVNNKIEFIDYSLEEQFRVLEVASDNSSVYALVSNSNYTTLNQEESPFYIVNILTNQILDYDFNNTIPYNLRIVDNQPVVSLIKTEDDLVKLFALEIESMPSSGLMSAGINNYEGEVVWSQSYYLQSFIDLLSPTLDLDYNKALEEIKPMVKNRLDFEITLLDKLLGSKQNLYCKAFTVDRSPALHIVQTGKMLLLLKRYRELPDAIELNYFDSFRNQVITLENHIEKIAQSDGSIFPLEKGRMFIMWPKGVQFWSDGVGVPYNHQNCWASGVMYNENISSLDLLTQTATKDISNQVLDLEGFNNVIPRYKSEYNSHNYYWDYWWGIAKTGWSENENISINTPSWRGNGNDIARPVYRTFDAISILISGKQFNHIDPNLVDYLSNAVEYDGLEMFLIPYLEFYGKLPSLELGLAKKYLRVEDQPGFRNLSWAYRIVSKEIKHDY